MAKFLTTAKSGGNMNDFGVELKNGGIPDQIKHMMWFSKTNDQLAIAPEDSSLIERLVVIKLLDCAGTDMHLKQSEGRLSVYGAASTDNHDGRYELTLTICHYTRNKSADGYYGIYGGCFWYVFPSLPDYPAEDGFFHLGSIDRRLFHVQGPSVEIDANLSQITKVVERGRLFVKLVEWSREDLFQNSHDLQGLFEKEIGQFWSTLAKNMAA